MVPNSNFNISSISYYIKTDFHEWIPLSLAPLNLKCSMILTIHLIIITYFLHICILHLFFMHINFVPVSRLENPWGKAKYLPLYFYPFNLWISKIIHFLLAILSQKQLFTNCLWLHMPHVNSLRPILYPVSLLFQF